MDLPEPTLGGNSSIYYGRSFGGAPCIDLAARHPPSTLVEESNFTSVDALVQDGASSVCRPSFVADDSWNNLGECGLGKMPFLVLHGAADDYVQPKYGQSSPTRTAASPAIRSWKLRVSQKKKIAWALDLVRQFGDGLASILQLNGTARYWRNRGNGEFDPPHSIPVVPTGANLGDPGVQLADIDGDGRPDLLLTSPTRTGYWPLASDGGFDPTGYARASPAPTFSLSDPLVRLIDLDGDGVMDVLRTGDRFELFYNDGDAGFTSLQVARARGTVPDISFADPRVRLADMTGDGLTDIVLVHNRYVSYWPNQGYGKWAARWS